VGLLVCFFCLSYSESTRAQSTQTVYGITQNAANPGLNWVMTNVLPQQAGLTVGNVIYQYTTVKNTEDDMVVYVQNEDAQNEGQYIFREADDWSGLPSNSIRKVVSVGGIPIDRWGDGSIEVEGKGSVTDPSVLYTYQYDPCFDPQTSPDCPGYKQPFVAIEEPDPYNALDEDYVQDEIDRKAVMKDEDQEDRDRRRVEAKEEIKENLEKILGTGNNTDIAAASNLLHSQLTMLDFMPTSYYETIPGGEYVETVELKDSDLPDNTSGRRAQFAQELLHEELVNLQYENKTEK